MGVQGPVKLQTVLRKEKATMGRLVAGLLDQGQGRTLDCFVLRLLRSLDEAFFEVRRRKRRVAGRWVRDSSAIWLKYSSQISGSVAVLPSRASGWKNPRIGVFAPGAWPAPAPRPRFGS